MPASCKIPDHTRLMIHKVRCYQDSARPQHSPNLPQGCFRVRHHMQRIGNEHDIKGSIRVRQCRGIRHFKGQVFRAGSFFRFPDHAFRIVGRHHALCRIGHMLCQQPRPGGDFQHFFSFDHLRDAAVHEFIELPVSPHCLLIDGCIEAPDFLIHCALLSVRSVSHASILVYTNLSVKSNFPNEKIPQKILLYQNLPEECVFQSSATSSTIIRLKPTAKNKVSFTIFH